MKLNIKKSAGSKKSTEPVHKNLAADSISDTDNSKSEVEKMIKEGTTGEKKVSVKIGKTDLFNQLSIDGSKKISGQRAFDKKRSAMQHYITKK